MTPDVVAAIASVDYRDNIFGRRRLYPAWDNLKDEDVFFRAVDMLEAAGVPASHLMAYMLVGFDKNETWQRIHHRFERNGFQANKSRRALDHDDLFGRL
jgi:hypothetical protein